MMRITTILEIMTVLIVAKIYRTANQEISSTAVEFLNLTHVGPYEYGPTISLVGTNYLMLWCSSRQSGAAWDWIYMSTSTDLMNWAPTSIGLQPQNSYQSSSVCDPSLVVFHNTWFLYHTCINTDSSPDGYGNNRICVATSDSCIGPFQSHSVPVIQDLTCTSNGSVAYCVGQPSALLTPDGSSILVYFSKQTPIDTQGPNPGQIYVAQSSDGFSFTWLNNGQPVFSQRDVDIKYVLSNNVYLMVQGDVGSNVITAATSQDGIKWTRTNQTVITNPGIPAGGVNHNPGLVGMPNGTITGDTTSVIYGSTYATTLDAWHLYKSDINIIP